MCVGGGEGGRASEIESVCVREKKKEMESHSERERERYRARGSEGVRARKS